VFILAGSSWLFHKLYTKIIRPVGNELIPELNQVLIENGKNFISWIDTCIKNTFKYSKTKDSVVTTYGFELYMEDIDLKVLSYILVSIIIMKYRNFDRHLLKMENWIRL